jgi:sialidase-1
MRGLSGHFRVVAMVAVFAAFSAAPHAQEAKPAPALEAVTMSDVFGRGEDGYPQVRIPAVVATPKGVVLAFAEGRQGDDHSENDIVLKRSLNGGATWQALQVVVEMGGDSLNDPCAVVLPEAGRVLLMYQRYPKGFHTEKMSHTEAAELGFGGPRNTQTFLTRSEDDGATWSKPEDIARSLRRPDAISVGSPGVGIQLRHGPHKGRILFPLYEVMPPGDHGGQCYNCAAISDDAGVSWRVGARIAEAKLVGEADECQLEELDDGTVVMDARQTSGNCRKGARSRDAGETWEPMYNVPDLVAPPCMGSILRIATTGESDVLATSMPNTLGERKNGTLFVSRDGGKTWPEKRVLYPGGFAYSCLTRLADDRIGCLFERDEYAHITFAVFDVRSFIVREDPQQPSR